MKLRRNLDGVSAPRHVAAWHLALKQRRRAKTIGCVNIWINGANGLVDEWDYRLRDVFLKRICEDTLEVVRHYEVEP